MQTAIKLLRTSLSSALDHQGKALYDDREIRSIIDLLLEEVCSITRLDRIMCPDQQLTAEQRAEIERMATSLSQGIPVQQVMGYTWFHGARFKVSPDVLIPRPETAELIDWIAEEISPQSATNDERVKILDIGTGSGIIALSLARLINNSCVLAADLSTAALSIARENSCQQGVDNVEFAQCDILTAVDKSSDSRLFNKFSTTSQHSSSAEKPSESTQLSIGYQQWDVIVSNPPYIARKEAAEMSDLVLRHEPSLALFVPDEDPLLFYRVIAQYALRNLADGGSLFFEINAAYGPEMVALLEGLGFENVELRKDVTGRDRMVKGTIKSKNQK